MNKTKPRSKQPKLKATQHNTHIGQNKEQFFFYPDKHKNQKHISHPNTTPHAFSFLNSKAKYRSKNSKIKPQKIAQKANPCAPDFNQTGIVKSAS